MENKINGVVTVEEIREKSVESAFVQNAMMIFKDRESRNQKGNLGRLFQAIFG